MKKRTTLRRICARLRPYGFLLFVSLLFSGAAVVLGLLIPRRIGAAIDSIVGQGQVDFAVIMRQLLFAALFALYYWSYHHFGVTVLFRNFIGNSMTRNIGGNMVTPRGYRDV